MSAAIDSGSRFSRMRGVVHIHEVQAGCRTQYFAVTYRDSSYNVALRESDSRKGSTRELARRDLAHCKL